MKIIFCKKSFKICLVSNSDMDFVGWAADSGKKKFLDLERNSTQVEGNALRSGLIGPGPKSDQDNTWANGSSFSNKDQNQFCPKIVDVSYLFKELNGGKTNT